MTGPLLAPQRLPSDAMRGLALPLPNDNGAAGVVLIYEGEFQSVLLQPLLNRQFDPEPTSEEHVAGDFRYRLIDLNGDRRPTLGAVVYRPAVPDESVLVMLVDEYATAQEREIALGQLIASLTPVTEQTLPALQRNFYGSSAADGQG
jgi:hypothetical protein